MEVRGDFEIFHSKVVFIMRVKAELGGTLMSVHGETNLSLTEPPPLMGNDVNTTLQRRGGTCFEKPLSQQVASLPRVVSVASKRSRHEHNLSSNDPL
jgi:hypothetical protein